MRWDDRIDAMEQRGFGDREDRRLINDFDTCLVGEALQDAKAPRYFSMGLKRNLVVPLGRLGAGLDGIAPSPSTLMDMRNWRVLRERLAEIRAVVSEAYPPPVVVIPAIHGIGQDEPARELIEA